MAAKATIYHNPNCGSSKNALAIAEELDVDVDVVLYLKSPPSAEELGAIIDRLEDPVTDLVRRDNLWKKLELTDDDVATREQVIEVLVRHHQLLQRPLVVTNNVALVGRPKDRVRDLLSSL